MPRKPGTKKYTGILAKPRKPWGPLSLIDTDEEIDRRLKADTDDFLHKFGLLLDYYGIKRDAPKATVELCHALMMAHVPGFQYAKGPGAPKTKTRWDVVLLVSSVNAIVEKGKLKATAYEALAKQGKFGGKAGTIKRRYEESITSPSVTLFAKMVGMSEGRLSWADIAVESGKVVESQKK